MKHFKKYFHLYILALLVFTFCFSVVIETIFKIDFKDCLMISISFLGLFATFGGAYLGAKISGDNARENMQIQLESQREENKRNETFTRKRLRIEMENSALKDYLIQLNELDNILQNMEIKINKYLLFTYEFGRDYQFITDDEYNFNDKKRVDDLTKIVIKHLEIEKQRNRVKIDKNISFKNNEEVPNVMMNMLEPVAKIEINKINEELLPTVKEYLVNPNDLLSGISDYLKFYNWIDNEKEEVIKNISDNLNSLKNIN